MDKWITRDSGVQPVFVDTHDYDMVKPSVLSNNDIAMCQELIDKYVQASAKKREEDIQNEALRWAVGEIAELREYIEELEIKLVEATNND